MRLCTWEDSSTTLAADNDATRAEGILSGANPLCFGWEQRRQRASVAASPRQGNSTRFIYADGEWRMAPDSNEINSTLTHRTLAARRVLLDYT